MADIKRVDAIAGEIVHEYDGIEEADNQLPKWWVAVFIGTAMFAAAYYFAYEKYHLLPSPTQELAAVAAERAKHSDDYSADELLAATKNPATVNAGKQAFTSNCIACHGVNAEGNIGPNLTDSSWLHGGAPQQIFHTIRDGVPAKGMPTWGAILGPAGVRDVAAYVLTVRNTNRPGKAAQGDVYNGS